MIGTNYSTIMSKKSKAKSRDVTSKRVSDSCKTFKVAKGESMYDYDEQKKNINLSLTPTAIDKLTKIARENNLSRSEYLERYLRNL